LKGAIQANLSKKNKKNKKLDIVDKTRPPDAPADESSKPSAAERDAEKKPDELTDKYWANSNMIKTATDHERTCRGYF